MSAPKLYAFPYNHRNGRQYTIEVHASDPEDARARLRAAYFQANAPEEIVFQATAPGWLGKMMGVK